jgi:uracil-DNA glycosylase family 4
MTKTDRLKILYDNYAMEFRGMDIVNGSGNPDSGILLIGEAPGKDEVRLGKPFVGAAGKQLSEFLELLGTDRDSIYITNAIKYRMCRINECTGRISNRPAKNNEIIINRRYLLEEIDIIKPDYIITLGNVPLRSVLGDMAATIGTVHGQMADVEILSRNYRLYPLYHPASIIYNRSLKDVYVKDVEFLRDYMSEAREEAVPG